MVRGSSNYGEKRLSHYVIYIFFLLFMPCQVFFPLDDYSFFLTMGMNREGTESLDNHPHHLLTFA